MRTPAHRPAAPGPAPRPGEGASLGLALSGGGFRAAFFHIGVLAQMARLGLLRHVAVVSTVSGGSIVGALYYAHVKRLLERTPDDAVTDDDYVAILERIEQAFLDAVRRNLRTRTFLDPLKTLRTSLPSYSRSDRIGELYDAHLYRPVLAPGRTTPVEMRELKIRPKGAPEGFHPLADNGARAAKVPVLVINATTLNTGHNWRFEASRMGEPDQEDARAREVDKNLRLRPPPSYEAIVPHQRNVELGLAVAASACVPGIFPPLALSGLYPEGIRVQLVDGGVHDNQGIAALRDLGCTHLVVSDASGQLEDELRPGTGLLAVLGRTNDILMDRVREEGLLRLIEREGVPVALVHLRKGLSARAVSWLGPDGRPAEAPQREREPARSSGAFGVDEAVQASLSRVRTDLDAFTEVEAFSLMMDGYLMSGRELASTSGIRDLASAPGAVRAGHWRFLEIGPWMARPNPRYLRHLEVARKRLFKVFRLSRSVAAVTALAAAGAAAGLGAFLGPWLADRLQRPAPAWRVAVAIAAPLALALAPRAGRPFRALLTALASPAAALHLLVFDRVFLCLGALKRLPPPAPDRAEAGGP